MVMREEGTRLPVGTQSARVHRASCSINLTLGLILCCLVSKFLIICEQGALHFHFSLSPTNYVADPG